MEHTITKTRTLAHTWVMQCTCGWADDPTGELELAEMAAADHRAEVRRAHNLSQAWAVDPEEF